MTDLKLAFCSREAATFATKAWHYSRSMPSGRLVCVGVWEDEAFIGTVVFGRGACSNIHSPFRLRPSEVCELCRVALGPHVTPTSRIVSIAVRLLRRQSPGIRLIVSYADPDHGHHGGIYAAMNWMYIGHTNAESQIRLRGRQYHPRTVASRYGTRSIDWLRGHIDARAAHVPTAPKFRYVLPLDPAIRASLVTRVWPYPKREQSAESGTPDSSRKGRCDATCSLQWSASHGA